MNTTTRIATRTTTAGARRAYATGSSLIVTETDRGETFDVHPSTTINDPTRTPWDELERQVTMWRGRYPGQTFYVLEPAQHVTRHAAAVVMFGTDSPQAARALELDNAGATPIQAVSI